MFERIERMLIVLIVTATCKDLSSYLQISMPNAQESQSCPSSQRPKPEPADLEIGGREKCRKSHRNTWCTWTSWHFELSNLASLDWDDLGLNKLLSQFQPNHTACILLKWPTSDSRSGTRSYEESSRGTPTSHFASRLHFCTTSACFHPTLSPREVSWQTHWSRYQGGWVSWKMHISKLHEVGSLPYIDCLLLLQYIYIYILHYTSILSASSGWCNRFNLIHSEVIPTSPLLGRFQLL